MSNKLLSVIIPLGSDAENEAAQDNIKQNIENFPSEDVEFVFVEYGTPSGKDDIIKFLNDGIRLVSLPDDHICPNAADARNIGAQYAHSNVIMFMDAADLWDGTFFDNVLRLIKIKNIAMDPDSFFGVPVIHVPENEAIELVKLPREYWRAKLIEELYSGNSKYKAQMRLASSSIVMNRHKFLSLGGYRAECGGRAYDDFEFLHRLTTDTGAFPVRPTNYYHDTKKSETFANYQYDGFRSLFSIIGREAMYNGIYLYHLKLPAENRAYRGELEADRNAAINYFKSYDEDRVGVPPLEDKCRNGGRTLLIDMPRKNFVNTIKDLLPYLGNISHREAAFFYEDAEFSESFLEDFLENGKFDRVMFSNPYGSEKRIPVYRHLRKIDFPVICFDRGALPDSWFFDCGFNYDSPSYDEGLWNKALSDSEKDEIRQYIRQTIVGEKYLEAQNRRIGSSALREQLELDGRKILFAPLQKPDDTVIKYFSGDVGSYENFLNELSELARQLARHDWTVIVKRHPLAENIEIPGNLVVAPNGSNIMDLLELADAVTVINSGVGLLSAMVGKPCYIWGNAFYQHEKINKKVTSHEEVENYIINGQVYPDMETVERFIHYLKNRLYSFGESKFAYSISRSGYIFKKTNSIDFWQLRAPHLAVDFRIDPDNRFMPNGFAFEIFREDMNTRFKNWRSELKKAMAAPEKPTSRTATGDYSTREINKTHDQIASIQGMDSLLHDLKVANLQMEAPQEKRGLFQRLFKQKVVIPQKLPEAELAKIMAAFKDKGFEAAAVLLDKIAPYPHLQADAYTLMARSVLNVDKRQAANLAYGAWRLHPRPYRQKWLAFRLYDVGDVEAAILLLESLPQDTAFTAAEKQKMEKIIACKPKVDNNVKSGS